MAKLTLEEERAREYGLMRYERQYEGEGLIAGVDEAGRGPLAGPVVAAAVILYPGAEILGINDSKQLSEKKREALYPEIIEKSMAVGVGIVGPGRIDEINILQATYEAMRKAVETLCFRPDLLLVDAVTVPGLEGIRQVPIIKGDAKSLSIGAASIVAKVTRDRIMREMDEIYPEYGFAGHKGYGTAAHVEALKAYGPCTIHRRSFITHFI